MFTSFETRIGAERAVQILGQALEGDEFSSRQAGEQWQTAVELFRTRRVLWVWDNFESTLAAFQRDEGLSPSGVLDWKTILVIDAIAGARDRPRLSGYENNLPS